MADASTARTLATLEAQIQALTTGLAELKQAHAGMRRENAHQREELVAPRAPDHPARHAGDGG
jgi:hypothetical protein